MYKFIQPCSISCNQEQFDTVKKQLVEMGYNIEACNGFDETPYLMTNYSVKHDDCVSVNASQIEVNDRIYLGEWNKDLFLAVASKTNNPEGTKGEWWRCVQSTSSNFDKGRIYKQIKSSINSVLAFCDNDNEPNGFGSANRRQFTKATTQEIINHFGTKQTKTETTMKTFPITRKQMKDVYDVACSQWKDKILKTTAECIDAFNDKGVIQESLVKEMFEASSGKQTDVLKTIFPEYRKDNNAFVEKFSHDTMSEMSQKLFGSSSTLEIATSAVGPSLKGRAFYLNSDYSAELININIGTVIKITKK